MTQSRDVISMLPLPRCFHHCAQAAFAAAADALDIRNDTAVIVYDTQGVFSAPRVWWTFKAFGHDRRAAQRCSSESRVPSRWLLVAGGIRLSTSACGHARQIATTCSSCTASTAGCDHPQSDSSDR